MGKKVPHCKECKRCQYIDYAYKSYYCSKENEPHSVFMFSSVDAPPKTSPKWCPKRNNCEITVM